MGAEAEIARTMRAQETAEALRGKRVFEYYVDMGGTPSAADFGGDAELARKVADAVEFERSFRKTKPMAEEMSDGLNNVQGLKTQNSLMKDGTKLIEMRPEEDDDYLPSAPR